MIKQLQKALILVFLSVFVLAFYFEKVIFIVVFSITAVILIFWLIYIKKIQKRRVRLRELNILLNALSIALVLWTKHLEVVK